MSFPQVEDALSRLGADIRTARIKRRIGMADMAARVGVTRKTISRLEKGDTSVGIDTFSTVLMVLGELHRLSSLLDPGEDTVGLTMDAPRLPSRVYKTRKITVRGETCGADADSPKMIMFSDEGTGF